MVRGAWCLLAEVFGDDEVLLHLMLSGTIVVHSFSTVVLVGGGEGGSGDVIAIIR